MKHSEELTDILPVSISGTKLLFKAVSMYFVNRFPWFMFMMQCSGTFTL